MRRTLLMIMAVALLLTQCRKPEVKFPTPSSAEGVTVSMTVTAGPGSKTDISETGGITWSEGDKLYVGDGSKCIGCLTLQGAGGSATGTFSGNVTLPNGTTGDQTFHFFYLGSNPPAVTSDASSVEVSFATQTGLLNDLGSCHVGYGSANGTVTNGVVTGINVTLVSKVALARFSFIDGTSPYSGELTLSGTHIYNSMTVNFGGTFAGEKTGGGKISLTNTTTSEKYVMLVPPATAVRETLEFGGEYEGDTELAQGIEANKYYGQGEPIEVVLTKVPVPVTGVTLNESSLSLAVGETETLVPMVLPADATNKNVTWGSSDETKATVDQNGVVTAVTAGPATITVTTADGHKTATCEVTVTAAPTPKFSVDDKGTKVEFAPGNLYYNGADDSHKMNVALPSGWNFYEHQWDYYVTDKDYVTASNEISLFTWGFGTWSTVYYTEDYEENTMTDWGSVAIGSDPANTWRTLSSAEWNYLLNTRTNATSLRACVTLEITETVSVYGLVILPDGSTVTANTVTTTALVASSGAVFLPAAGERGGTDLHSVGSSVDYWSSTPLPGDGAHHVHGAGIGGSERYKGFAVRLAR